MSRSMNFCFKPAMLLFLAMCWLCNPLMAVNLDRPFPQIINNEFMAQIKASQGLERAVFTTIAGQERILYLRFSRGGYVLRDL